MSKARGMVCLVGAGPGDPGLITARGLDLLRSADVVVHDSLIGMELLTETRPGAEIINVGRVRGRRTASHGRAHTLLLERAKQGKTVVRLMGGDPFVFGRGFEELMACRKEGVDCVLVPGVSSALAGPAAAGIPITERRHVRSFAVVAGTSATECTAPPLDYDALAAIDTVIVLMAGENLAEVTQSLIRAGREPSTPTACVEWATTARQRTTLATLEDIVEAADRDGLESPVVAVVGDVASHATKTGLAAFGLLAGKRIVITRPRSTSGELRRAFSAAGAAVVLCPMIKIVYPPETDALDDAIRALSRYDWLAFTSVHGVRGFWRRLFALDQDARSLAGCSVAAVGSATARAIRRRGINVDLVPQPHTGVALAQALSETIRDSSVRVLYPRADIAAPVLADGLRSEGAVVDDIVAYHTVDAAPSEATLRIIREGFDAVVFCSPSAVRRFVSLELDVSGAAIACIGPSTTAAAQQVGLTVDVVPEEQTADALVAAVVGRFAAAGKAPSLPSDCSRC